MHDSSTHSWPLTDKSERKGQEKQKKNAEGYDSRHNEKEENICKYRNKKQRKKKATNRSVWKNKWRRTEAKSII